MNKNIIVGVIVVIVLALGGWWFYNQNAPVPASQQTEQTTVTPTIQTHEILYTDTGFSPANLTIKVGDTVTWKNQSSSEMWVGSANHPSHTVYSGTTLQQHCPDSDNVAFDECTTVGPGGSWSFTFTKAGSFGYHNHANASKFGKIVVE